MQALLNSIAEADKDYCSFDGHLYYTTADMVRITLDGREKRMALKISVNRGLLNMDLHTFTR